MKFVGYHKLDSLPFKKQDECLVWAGTKVNTTNPNKAPFYYTKKITLVVVDHVLTGISIEGKPIQNPQIVWVDGAYTNSVDMNDLFSQ